jgi:hypothetical protein
VARIYATSDDYGTFTGQTPPADIDALLARATRLLEARVFRLCWYRVDEAGLPSETVVSEAFRDSVCAQVQWWDEVGDSIGAAGAGWSSVSIGSASMSRSSGAPAGEDSPARQIAPQVWDILRSPDLTPDVLGLGTVVTL